MVVEEMDMGDNKAISLHALYIRLIISQTLNISRINYYIPILLSTNKKYFTILSV